MCNPSSKKEKKKVLFWKIYKKNYTWKINRDYSFNLSFYIYI